MSQARSQGADGDGDKKEECMLYNGGAVQFEKRSIQISFLYMLILDGHYLDCVPDKVAMCLPRCPITAFQKL